MDLVEIVKADYQKFPAAQTYDIYARDVYFQDPVFKFRGLGRYKLMIGFITTWFKALKLELHEIDRIDDTIKTRWTMSWNAPLPWKPRISVDGWSELKLNAENTIVSHVDYWDCSRWDVIKQHIPAKSTPNPNADR
jgi:hypothetical protein